MSREGKKTESPGPLDQHVQSMPSFRTARENRARASDTVGEMEMSLRCPSRRPHYGQAFRLPGRRRIGLSGQVGRLCEIRETRSRCPGSRAPADTRGNETCFMDRHDDAVPRGTSVFTASFMKSPGADMESVDACDPKSEEHQYVFHMEAFLPSLMAAKKTVRFSEARMR